MILRRLGNKSKIATKIQSYFPEHKIYIEPFFGAGGMFFNKPKAKYNIVNDLDSDVFNLFQVVMNQKEEFEEIFKRMPIHSDLLKYWKENQEIDSIKKALRFIFLSNFNEPTTGDIKRRMQINDKKQVESYLKPTFDYLENVQFFNKDFELFINHLYWNPERPRELENSFIYCDPPYISASNNYSNSFSKGKHLKLHDTLEKTGCKYAISEFDNPFVLQQAKERNLNIHIIGARQNLKNRRTEILITNYKKEQTLFDNL
jgi:DNA adenine methylase